MVKSFEKEKKPTHQSKSDWYFAESLAGSDVCLKTIITDDNSLFWEVLHFQLYCIWTFILPADRIKWQCASLHKFGEDLLKVGIVFEFEG